MDSAPLDRDDADLWARSLRGDGRAFAGLFDRHRDRVFRSVLRLVVTTHEAEDVVATTFLELWRLEGLTLGETAQVLGITVDAAK